MPDYEIKKSYIGTVKALYYNYLDLFKIFIIVNLGLFIIFMTIETSIFLSKGNGGASIPGMLSTTCISSIITFLINGIIMSSKKELNSKMIFPVSKIIYSIAQFSMMFYASLIMLTICLIFSLLEICINRIFAIYRYNYIFIPNILSTTFKRGVLLSFFFVPLFGSITYLISMYIRKWLIPSLMILTSFIMTLIINDFVTFYIELAKVLFFDESIIVNIIKLFSLTLFFNLLAYIPLKYTEVGR